MTPAPTITATSTTKLLAALLTLASGVGLVAIGRCGERRELADESRGATT
jgi:hypothetical protein